MRAYSLIEFVVSIAILMVLAGAIAAVCKVADDSWHSDRAMLILQQESRYGIDTMVKELRQARPEDVQINADGSLSFVIPLSIFNSTPVYSSQIKYSLSNAQLIREHPSNVTAVLANDINSLSFCWQHSSNCNSTCVDSSLLNVKLNASKTTKQRTVFFPSNGTLTEQIRLRNAQN